MSAIFGLLRRDGGPLAAGEMQTMRRAVAHWGPDGGGVWQERCAGLGQALLCSTPESRYEQLPCFDAGPGVAFTAAVRLDNRAELIRQLDVGRLPTTVSDGEILRQAYLRWGAACVERVYGDWAFAAWHPAERTLFLARDHFGNTALYYHADPRVFVFASDRQALLDMKVAPITLDELYLAQMMTSWPAYHGERTIHSPLKRLPPAHTLTVTPDRLEVRQYWFLERTPELRLRRREEYVEAFREVVDEAVRVRLRCPGELAAAPPIAPGPWSCCAAAVPPGTPIAATLSGGLDSSSVTATAAAILRAEGTRLTAFTSVPLSDTTAYLGTRFGDELPLALAVAQLAGNVDVRPVPAAGVSPLEGIRRGLQIHHEPGHAAGNQYWLLDLMATARAAGCQVLLTGQHGNAAFSWAGSTFSLPPARQLSELGWRRWLKARVTRGLPPRLYRAARRLAPGQGDAWVRRSPLRPDVAARLDLWERRLADPSTSPARTPIEERRWLMPGRSFGGALWAEMGAAMGLDVRDPTADARVLAFSFSVPDRVFRDPETGIDRWLIRAAMAGRLPDSVRLNRRRGGQAGDLVPRLRACATDVEATLDELARGPAAAYVDLPHVRRAWQVVQTRDTPEAYREAATVLTRGIAAGLFVNSLLTLAAK